MSSLTVEKEDIAAVGTSGSTDEDDSCNEETIEIKTQPKPPPKPRRPFTAYNIFFQLERSYILQTADGSTYLPKLDANNIDVNTSSRPPKYRDIIMAKNWYNIQVHSNRKKNRSKKYRENHGLVSFVELSKAVAKHWREVDEDTKMYCRNLAEEELDRYQDDMDRYQDDMDAYIEKYGYGTIKKQPKKKKTERSKSGAIAAATAVAGGGEDKYDSDDDGVAEGRNQTMHQKHIGVNNSDKFTLPSLKQAATQMNWQNSFQNRPCPPSRSPLYYEIKSVYQIGSQKHEDYQQEAMIQRDIATMQASQLNEQELRYKSMSLQKETKHVQYFAQAPTKEFLRLKSMEDCKQRDRIEAHKRIERARAENSRFIWTQEEDWILLELHQMYGSQWDLIASLLQGRTHQEVKSRWHSLECSQELLSPHASRMHINNVMTTSFLDNAPYFRHTAEPHHLPNRGCFEQKQVLANECKSSSLKSTDYGEKTNRQTNR